MESENFKNNEEAPDLVNKPKLFKPVNNPLVSILAVFALCFVLFTFAFQVILRPISVNGYSMLPTINTHAQGTYGTENTDVVYYCKPTKENLVFGSIIITNDNYTPTKHKLIKRIIGKPGDTLKFKIDDSTYHLNDLHPAYYYDVYLNGEKLEELNNSLEYLIKERMEYMFESTDVMEYAFFNTFSTALATQHEFSITLENNQYFIMGDNRNDSVDSRYFGPVNYSDITGKLVLLVPYGETLASVLLAML